MTNIIEAVKSIISKNEKITCVKRINDEIFFLFNEKYKLSMMSYHENSDRFEYLLNCYPGTEKLEELYTLVEANEINKVSSITYRTDELKSREAYESFQQLFKIIEEKSLGIDKILDEIISIE